MNQELIELIDKELELKHRKRNKELSQKSK